MKLRDMLSTHKDLARKLEELEKKCPQHHAKFKVVFDAIRKLIQTPAVPHKPRIGFTAFRGEVTYAPPRWRMCHKKGRLGLGEACKVVGALAGASPRGRSARRTFCVSVLPISISLGLLNHSTWRLVPTKVPQLPGSSAFSKQGPGSHRTRLSCPPSHQVTSICPFPAPLSSLFSLK